MPGTVVHAEIPATDVGRAAGFWSGVFGWQIGDSMSPDYEYRMFQSGEGQGGAVMQSEQPGHLVVYFETANIEDSLAKVREHGGTAGDKQPVPTHGWFAPCTDTEGNAFSLWQTDSNAA
jgi:hypothetical protein